MGKRITALGLALMLTLALSSCSRTDSRNSGTGAGRLSDRGSSGTELPAQRDGSLMEDGRYYAGTDGAVNPRRELGESEWEKLGRELRQSWDNLMKGTQDAAQDLEKGTERAVEKAENRM